MVVFEVNMADVGKMMVKDGYMRVELNVTSHSHKPITNIYNPWVVDII